MIALLTACLISAPDECRSWERPLSEWHPVMQMREAETMAAEWLQGHPGYVVTVRVVRGRSA